MAFKCSVTWFIWIKRNSNKNRICFFINIKILHSPYKRPDFLRGVFDYENTTLSGLTSTFSAKSIHFDTEGRQWLGLLTGGVLLRQNSNWQNLNLPNIFPAGMAVSQNAISQGQFGKIYFGTSTGLVIYNGGLVTDETSYKRLTTANGLPSNNILDVIERQDGLLIVATDAGIAFLKK